MAPHVPVPSHVLIFSGWWSWWWCSLRLRQLHQEHQAWSPGEMVLLVLLLIWWSVVLAADPQRKVDLLSVMSNWWISYSEQFNLNLTCCVSFRLTAAQWSTAPWLRPPPPPPSSPLIPASIQPSTSWRRSDLRAESLFGSGLTVSREERDGNMFLHFRLNKDFSFYVFSNSWISKCTFSSSNSSDVFSRW